MLNNIKVLILVITAICFLTTSKGTASSSSSSTAPTISPETLADFIKKNNQFTLSFYQQLINNDKNKGKSLIFSPFSIRTAGGLLYAGADKNTADEILQGFSLPGHDQQSVSNAFAGFFQTRKDLLTAGPLKMANKIYVADGYTLKPSFIDIAVNQYDSGIENINFVDAENAAQTINHWIENNTGDKIHDLVKSDSLTDFTRMFLVNAIYFKGEWETKFDSSRTQESEFFITPENVVPMQMMSRFDNIEHNAYYDLSAVGVNLKFKNSDLSLFIMMPLDLEDSLSDLEKKLSNLNMQQIFDKVSAKSVSLSMPKFKIELNVDLKKVLQQLNLKDMFDMAKADFSNLLDTSEKVFVSDAAHKAAIEINEDGAEASAASGFTMTSRMGPMFLNINYPFLYFIKSESGAIYFMGRFTGQ